LRLLGFCLTASDFQVLGKHFRSAQTRICRRLIFERREIFTSLAGTLCRDLRLKDKSISVCGLSPRVTSRQAAALLFEKEVR
jgi:hypothetical protein